MGEDVEVELCVCMLVFEESLNETQLLQSLSVSERAGDCRSIQSSDPLILCG